MKTRTKPATALSIDVVHCHIELNCLCGKWKSYKTEYDPGLSVWHELQAEAVKDGWRWSDDQANNVCPVCSGVNSEWDGDPWI